MKSAIVALLLLGLCAHALGLVRLALYGQTIRDIYTVVTLFDGLVLPCHTGDSQNV